MKMRRQSGQIVLLVAVLTLCAVAVNCSGDLAATADKSTDDWLVPMLATFRRGLYQAGPPQYQAPTSADTILPSCMHNLTQLSKNYKALDAFGKPGAGLFEGNGVWLGNYDECLSIKGFRYCLSDLLLNASKIGIQGVPVINVRWGLCAPASCSSQDLLGALQHFQDLLELKYVDLDAITAVSMTCSESPPIPYSAGVICTVVLLSTLGALMVVGTLYDEWSRFDARKLKWRGRWLYCAAVGDSDEDALENGKDFDDMDSCDDDVEPLYGREASRRWNLSVKFDASQVGLPGRIFLCFAVTRNLAKLFNVQQKDTSVGSLNGIRFISMTWVILAHTLFFSTTTKATQNTLVLLEWVKSFGFQAISNAFLAVDSFFFLSGFLVSFLTLSRMQELRSVKGWVWFYFHRYWRLTPTLGLTILVWMYIEPFLGDGPLWYASTNKTQCEKFWWTDLLYINNFYPQGFMSECVGWAWYLANDMQFFVISPLLLVPLFYAPVIGCICLVSLMVVCMIVTAVIIVEYDATVDILGVRASMMNDAYGLDDNSLIYDKPYCRIAPYLVGVGLGYIVHRIGSRRIKMSPLFSVVGWLVAVAVATSVVYGFYPSYSASVPLSRAAQVAYGTLSRFAWGVALAWLVFACKYGYGGWINRFLSWSFWVPLARLTYSAYLFHPIVLVVFYNNFGTPIYESKYLLAYYFAGNLLLSYAVALFVALAVEYPLAGLEKLFMPDNPKAKLERYCGDIQNLRL